MLKVVAPFYSGYAIQTAKKLIKKKKRVDTRCAQLENFFRNSLFLKKLKIFTDEDTKKTHFTKEMEFRSKSFISVKK